MPLILASASRYKALLLERLQLPFECLDARVDETPVAGESARATAERLAIAKAEAGLKCRPDACVVGADQVASSEGIGQIGKPGSLAANQLMLQRLSGRTVTFYTAAAVLSAADPKPQICVDVTEVVFRQLSDTDIHEYLAREPSVDCAGGCKVEGLGITLLQSVRSEDPTALIGLPLIALSGVLRDYGHNALAAR